MSKLHYQNTRKHNTKSCVTNEKKQENQNQNRKDLLFSFEFGTTQ